MIDRGRSADPRAERVRARLREAAFAMAHERPVDEITVGDLVARAQVSRQVFYRHFRDRDDAVNLAFTQAFADATARCHADPRTRITDLFAFAAEHRKMYRNIVPSTVTQHVVRMFRAALLPPCEQIATQGMAVVSTIAPLSVDAVTRFLVGGLMEVLRSWMEDPDASDLAGRVQAALDTIDALLGISFSATPDRKDP
ncbi:TetR/AcrR family transcriptional regulator [Mycolicibacterium sp. 018/SC-01/001]|uniref:TetR/AcrR family transcriptional regulator n=1 Tax=Mycolicibacterium sp. 018/SC-01/001 TaxID=2592069 RepID=UPI00118074DB|nr:TetR/AcrR family transcriptional regulator [Mycolicibacterium sp. 018/SC-01/001]TRW82425.1 TetR/AcrR family transcriptional regulator [Mycolicibacterium sp. 018/SC-01/001]